MAVSKIYMVKSGGRMRIDQALVERGLCESRERARRSILAGEVRVNQQLAHKPSDLVKASDALELAVPEKYVSRGGLKLEGALRDFKVDVSGMVAIDLGASTGGFTDCLLQHGCTRVYAVDVGWGQLAWKLRNDARVVVMERTNARHLNAASFPAPFEGVDLVVADCSFISLRLILPAARGLVRPGGHILALIKPQFEAGKREVDRGEGVIRDPEVHRRVIDELRHGVEQEPDLSWIGVVGSDLIGPAGNKEFFTYIERH